MPHFDPTALVRIRRERGLSQEALARRLRRDRLQIVRWERQGAAPSPRRLVALAKALAAAPWELTTVTPKEATLADLRAWAGLTQAELAERAGLVRTTYAALERGELPLRPDVARQIARALGRGTRVADVAAAYGRSAPTPSPTSTLGRAAQVPR